jgi:GntR family transcriptional regulator
LSPGDEDESGDAPFRPLYAQVQARLVERIACGSWKPGQLLPNEFQLAEEYSVSQGTIRKALIALESDKLITRRQGAGTYVARHTGETALFKFFRLLGRDDSRRTPTSVVLHQREARATASQAKRLAVPPGEPLHAITRVRYFDGIASIYEQIHVPVVLMPDLQVETGREMEAEMYVIYQERYLITIARAVERLEAVAATSREAKLLDVGTGSPLLEINRIALDINGTPIELRVSRCVTAGVHYAADVS